MDDLLRAVLDIAARHVDAERASAVGPDTDLSALGLASLEMVGFILDLERGLAVRFPADLIDPATFRDARTIAGHVRALREPG
ncbi:phosphopantetheine-binding protein [Sorangium sp. So ce128]|uniref:phosphopantetheine-binding protein n=1 Tax=Sorangium sp. So ce128 TaxID=3133281 RepID=UPI003F5E719B